ncbi:HdeD family acid-resistance protein [Pragia fontium]|uniref:HdeD family acid-resistance protein n=1 Tax=Pragia fontium TaxID=82985 RepID=UPI0006499222|nr:DUF308 domain-containing protein [Pragia fontium]AKJ41513.1 membrane protein [Pragia fontium]
MNQDVIGKISRNWWILVVYGIIAIVFSISAVFAPLSTALAIAWAIGLLALVEGIITLASLFTTQTSISKGWLILYAVISIIFGIITLYNPAITANVMLVFLAVWLIIAGIYRIIFAIQVRNQIKGEWLIILSGILAILLGILLISQPITGLIVTTIWIGAIVLVYGLLQLYAGFKLRKFNTHTA